ncbi:hypothetical protein Pelo_19770 [Pelomyxa schiedti]|nr:hypothetical protein Pelo_19770 [Pelomyxa schiedti]
MPRVARRLRAQKNLGEPQVEEVLANDDDDDAGGDSASRRSSAQWVCIDAGGHGADGDDDVDVDVVFSHTVPGDAIGEGDEASVLVCLGKNARKTITVDLAESFSRGSLVAVTEGTECATSQWARWHPFLFMDGIGNQVLVQEEFEPGACVFAVNITTGRQPACEAGHHHIQRVHRANLHARPK